MMTLRDTAMAAIENYRDNSEWSVGRQVVLQCLSATWSEWSTPDRVFRLAEPLTGQALPLVSIGLELGKMRKAGLIRRRMIAGILGYELILP